MLPPTGKVALYGIRVKPLRELCFFAYSVKLNRRFRIPITQPYYAVAALVVDEFQADRFKGIDDIDESRKAYTHDG